MRTIYDNGHYCSKFGSLERPQRSYFSQYFPKRQFLIKIYHLWRWSHRNKTGGKFSRFRISKLIFRNSFGNMPNTNYQVANIAVFSIFWPFSEFSRIPRRKTKKYFPYSGYSTKRSLVGNILVPKPRQFYETFRVCFCTYTSYFFYKSKKPSFLIKQPFLT